MKKRYLVVVAASVVVVAGCGGGSSSKSSSAGSDTTAASQQDTTAASQQDTTAASQGDANQQDAAAKSSARNLVTEVETCFTDQSSYSACQKPSGTQLPIGSSPGQVEVSAVTDTGFTIVAHSPSGTSFKIEKNPSGAMSRTCDHAGTGGCQAGGTW
jgi:hypothetical protein